MKQPTGHSWLQNQMARAEFKPISRAEEVRLFERIRLGDKKAEDRIVKANMKFVVRVAMMYTKHGLSMDDLVAEGALGLVKAVRRFDHLTGNKFISYAVWWIRQGIMAALGGGGGDRNISLHSNKVNLFSSITRSIKRLEQQLGRAPSTEEIMDDSRLTHRDVLEYFIYCGNPEMSVNWDTDEDGNGGAGREPSITDPGPLPDAGALHATDMRHYARLMEDLKPREREIVKRAYGLDAAEPQILQRIGDDLGLTRERARQIKEKAIERIQAKARQMKAQEIRETALRKSMACPRTRVSIGQASQ